MPQREDGQARLHLCAVRLPADGEREPSPHCVDDVIHRYVCVGLCALSGIAVMASQRILDPSPQLGPVHGSSLRLITEFALPGAVMVDRDAPGTVAAAAASPVLRTR